jgi:hypothetical protein
MSDSDLLNAGFECLEEKLGLVEAQRFIALVNANHFDYTKWQENLFVNMSVEELGEKAMQYQREMYGNEA